ncbi:MAG TPA: alpha/beta fold hydrolase [Vicinamibacteria bacterium]
MSLGAVPSMPGPSRRGAWRTGLACGLVVALAAGNALAYRHARAFTHFASAGRRTPKPEALSTSEKLHALFAGPVILRPANWLTPQALGLEYERRTFVTADGVTLEAWLVPALRAHGLVVMFHGYADSKASLLPEARALHRLGWSTLMVDFRGSGGSAGDETTVGFREAEDVAAAFEQARALFAPRIVLFGASMGAAAVLKAVSEHRLPADALLLESPFDRLVSAVAHRCQALGLPAFPAAYLLVFWGGWQQHYDGFRHNPVDYASSVDRPTLLMQGDADGRVSVDEARAIFERLRGPKRLKLFHGVKHMSIVRARPAEWTEAVEAFLERPGG